jgi:hypothetical protein
MRIEMVERRVSPRIIFVTNVGPKTCGCSGRYVHSLSRVSLIGPVSGNLLGISVDTSYGLRPGLRTTRRRRSAHKFWEGVGVGSIKLKLPVVA